MESWLQLNAFVDFQEQARNESSFASDLKLRFNYF